jgi:phosphonopyruvate decarboxylase
MKKGIDSTKLSPRELYRILIKNGVNYFCGVPDSSLSSFGFYLADHIAESNDIAVNEGSAVAMAIGYYLATSKLPLVYMQNSGLGNAINPLVSLADPLIMGIPMILLIGWRGQPGKEDEPQHMKQGLVTTGLLDTLDIPYVVLSHSADTVSLQVKKAAKETLDLKRPVALLVERETLGPYKKPAKPTNYPLSREEVIGYIAESLADSGVVVATTGKTGRELFEFRENKDKNHAKDLLIVGGMGHASAIAMAIAQQKPKRKIYCIDGDGAVLMHMGFLGTIGSKKLKNFYHFVINNGSHESVGGQPTVGFDIDMPAIAKACGYAHIFSVDDRGSLDRVLSTTKKLDGPVFIEVRVNSGSRPDLTRPSIHPSENKDSFMSYLNDI